MSVEIKHYSVHFTNQKNGYAYIMLYEISAESTSVGVRARLNFIPMADGTDYTNLSVSTSGAYTGIGADMNIKVLPYIIDMLRNEKPVYLTWNEEKHLVIIGTNADEPVGEKKKNPIPFQETLLQYKFFFLPG